MEHTLKFLLSRLTPGERQAFREWYVATLYNYKVEGYLISHQLKDLRSMYDVDVDLAYALTETACAEIELRFTVPELRDKISELKEQLDMWDA